MEKNIEMQKMLKNERKLFKTLKNAGGGVLRRTSIITAEFSIVNFCKIINENV